MKENSKTDRSNPEFREEWRTAGVRAAAPLTPDEAKRIRIALIFGDPSVQGQPDPALEEAKRKLALIEKQDA